MRCSQRFGEKALGCLSISSRTQEEVQSIARRIHRPIQVHPHLFHFDIRLIDAPRVVRGLEMGLQCFSSSGVQHCTQR
jgi:hypothetical protein